MGIVSRLRSRPPAGEQRATAIGDYWESWGGDNDRFRYPWTDRLASGLRLSVIYGCVSLIASRISSLPVSVMNADGGIATEADARQPWIDHPDPYNAPHGMSRQDVLSQIVTSLLLDGNAYIAVGRDRSMRVAEIRPLNPQIMSMIRLPNGTIDLRVGGSRPPYELRVIRNIVLPGRVYGLSPIDAARTLLDIGFGVHEQSAKFFEQGAVLPGVITTDGAMTNEQMEQMAEMWRRRVGGTRNAHTPLILEAAKYQPISVSPEQAQFLATRGFTDAQIAGQIFHVDPSLVGITQEGSNLTYQNVGQRNRQLLDDALFPLMNRIERAFTSILPRGQQYKFDTTEFLRADTKTRFETYALAAQVSSTLGQPLLTISEMRERESLPPLGLPEMPMPPAPKPSTPPPVADIMPDDIDSPFETEPLDID